MLKWSTDLATRLKCPHHQLPLYSVAQQHCGKSSGWDFPLKYTNDTVPLNFIWPSLLSLHFTKRPTCVRTWSAVDPGPTGPGLQSVHTFDNIHLGVGVGPVTACAAVMTSVVLCDFSYHQRTAPCDLIFVTLQIFSQFYFLFFTWTEDPGHALTISIRWSIFAKEGHRHSSGGAEDLRWRTRNWPKTNGFWEKRRKKTTDNTVFGHGDSSTADVSTDTSFHTLKMCQITILQTNILGSDKG